MQAAPTTPPNSSDDSGVKITTHVPEPTREPSTPERSTSNSNIGGTVAYDIVSPQQQLAQQVHPTHLKYLGRRGSKFVIPTEAEAYVQPLLKPGEDISNKDASLFAEEKVVTEVLVLYTGGTIGMRKSSKGYVPVTDYFEDKLMSLPMFNDPSATMKTKRIVKDHTGLEVDLNFIPLPISKFGQRVRYCIDEYNPLLDSSDMGMEEWLKIAGDIQRNYDRFDAFVILHGTDTMAYTSSALSFIFENLGKSVYITGSQIPLSELRNDAVDNLQGVLTMAGHYRIPEVLVYFNNKVMRGNRVTKSDAESLDAFATPQIDPIATLGVTVKIEWNDVFHNEMDGQPFTTCDRLEPQVAVLRLFPGITIEAIRSFLSPPTRGVILQTYGAGNGPARRRDVMDAFKEASDRGVVIVNVTQCSKGKVVPLYGVGQTLVEAGVLPGADMTVEAALCKLAYLLGKGLSRDKIKEMVTTSLRGEMTPAISETKFTVQDEDFVHAVAMAMHSTSSEKSLIQRRIENMVMTSAAGHGLVADVAYIANLGVDLNYGDYDKRTALHLAAGNGHVTIVRFLLQRNADVNVIDRFGRSPLFEALENGHIDCATELYNHEAVLGIDDRKACRLLCQLAADDEHEKIKTYIDFGIKVNVHTTHQRTPLHVAVTTSSLESARVLIEAGADPTYPDFHGHSPLDEALSKDSCDNTREALIEILKQGVKGTYLPADCAEIRMEQEKYHKDVEQEEHES